LPTVGRSTWSPAVANHKASQDALLTDREAYKRNMVRTAILLAHPVKA